MTPMIPWLVAATVSFVAAGVAYVTARRRLAEGQRVVGTVVEMTGEWDPDGLERERLGVAFFPVGSTVMHRFRDAIGASPFWRRCGQKVEVIYDPANPQIAVVGGASLYFWTVCWAAGGVGLLAGACFVA